MTDSSPLNNGNNAGSAKNEASGILADLPNNVIDRQTSIDGRTVKNDILCVAGTENPCRNIDCVDTLGLNASNDSRFRNENRSKRSVPLW